MTTSELILMAVKAVASVIQIIGAFMLAEGMVNYLDAHELSPTKNARRALMSVGLTVFLLALSLIGTWWGVRL